MTKKAKISPLHRIGSTYNDVYPETSFIPAKTLDRLRREGLELPDLEKIRSYRVKRIIDQMARQHVDALLLFDPINIRYTTDSSNMQIWTSHNLARAALITADGYIVLWDFTHCEHLTEHLPQIDEIRSGAGSFYFEYGDAIHDKAKSFSDQVIALVKKHASGMRLGVDRMDTVIAQAFLSSELTISDAWPVMEHARLIKSIDEMKAMRCAMNATEFAMAKMEAAMKPSMSEVELWSVLHAENIAQGGEWIETRILASGPRTNPWMSEASGRIMESGDIMAFDTDMIGIFGICCDVSRTWLVGDADAKAEQQEIYRVAHDHILENMDILKPGIALKDLSYLGHKLPQIYQANKYCVKMHGVGLCDEFPSIYYPDAYIDGSVDYELMPGMTLCVEAFIGKEGGHEGIKLENQVLITETGFENLTAYHYDQRLLG